MSFRLSDLLNFNQPAQTAQMTDTTSDASSVSDASGNARLAYLMNELRQGQTVSGMVKEVDGNRILLDMGSQTELAARLDSEVLLSVGQIVTFEVKSNQNSRLSLTPLFTNTSANVSTILNALNAAEMPVTAENVSMVSSMIQEGMSIDKGSLWNMSRLSASFGSYQPSSVAELTGMGLEVNENNLRQLEAYHNMKYQILDVLTELSGEMDQTWQEYGGQGQEQRETGIQFMQRILEALSGDTQPGEGSALSQEGVLQNPLLQSLTGKNDADLPYPQIQGMKDVQNLQNMQAVQNLQDEQDLQGDKKGQSPTAGKAELQQSMPEQTEGQIREVAKLLKEAMTPELKMSETAESTSPQTNQANELVKALQSGKPESLIGWLKQAGSAEILKQLQAGVLKPEQFVKVLEQALHDDYFNGNQGAAHFQDAGKAFQKLFTGLLRQQWEIEPEEVAQKNDVKEFYQKLEQQSARLMQVMDSFDKTASAAGKTIQQLNQNMDFIHALNQVFPYIQLPLRASRNSAHGDLYVYMNRREKQSQDGSVSALLHLEMANLGNLDVYVKMQDHNLQTHFYLQDDSVIDFLSGHMEQLNERLQKKGYAVRTEVTGQSELQGQGNEQKQDDIISRIRGTGRADKSLVSMTSFDVRA